MARADAPLVMFIETAVADEPPAVDPHVNVADAVFARVKPPPEVVRVIPVSVAPSKTTVDAPTALDSVITVVPRFNVLVLLLFDEKMPTETARELVANVPAVRVKARVDPSVNPFVARVTVPPVALIVTGKSKVFPAVLSEAVAPNVHAFVPAARVVLVPMVTLP